MYIPVDAVMADVGSVVDVVKLSVLFPVNINTYKYT